MTWIYQNTDKRNQFCWDFDKWLDFNIITVIGWMHAEEFWCSSANCHWSHAWPQTRQGNFQKFASITPILCMAGLILLHYDYIVIKAASAGATRSRVDGSMGSQLNHLNVLIKQEWVQILKWALCSVNKHGLMRMGFYWVWRPGFPPTIIIMVIYL